MERIDHITGTQQSVESYFHSLCIYICRIVEKDVSYLHFFASILFFSLFTSRCSLESNHVGRLRHVNTKYRSCRTPTEPTFRLFTLSKRYIPYIQGGTLFRDRAQTLELNKYLFPTRRPSSSHNFIFLET